MKKAVTTPKRKVPLKQRVLVKSANTNNGGPPVLQISDKLVEDSFPHPAWVQRLLDHNSFDVQKRWRTEENRLKYQMSCKLCAAIETNIPGESNTISNEQLVQDIRSYSFDRHLKVSIFWLIAISS